MLSDVGALCLIPCSVLDAVILILAAQSPDDECVSRVHLSCAMRDGRVSVEWSWLAGGGGYESSRLGTVTGVNKLQSCCTIVARTDAFFGSWHTRTSRECS